MIDLQTGVISDDEFSNSSYDYTDYNYSDTCCGNECDQVISMHFDAIFIPLLYSLALVVGLPGNGLVLVVLWKKRQSWNVTDIFILHLGIADSLLLLTLSLWAIEAVQGWSFGTGLCKLAGALFKINFYCGIFMLACISLDRYLSIVHAVQMYSRKRPVVIHSCCLIVWIFCLLLSVPDWIYLTAVPDIRRHERIECVPNYGNDSGHLISRLIYHVIGFILPALMMLFCYSRILLRLRRGSQCQQKKRAMRVIVALVLAFFISWTPFNITLLIDTIQTQSNNSTNQTSCASTTALNVALTSTSTLGYLHCCVNPVLYAFVGVKFRHQLLDILRPLGFTFNSQTGMMSQMSAVQS